MIPRWVLVVSFVFAVVVGSAIVTTLSLLGLLTGVAWEDAAIGFAFSVLLYFVCYAVCLEIAIRQRRARWRREDMR